MRVGVSVTRVDEAVFKRPADVMDRKPCYRRHHVPRELTHLQSLSVLTSPPVVLCSKQILVQIPNFISYYYTYNYTNYYQAAFSQFILCILFFVNKVLVLCCIYKARNSCVCADSFIAFAT